MLPKIMLGITLLSNMTKQLQTLLILSIFDLHFIFNMIFDNGP